MLKRILDGMSGSSGEDSNKQWKHTSVLLLLFSMIIFYGKFLYKKDYLRGIYKLFWFGWLLQNERTISEKMWGEGMGNWEYYCCWLGSMFSFCCCCCFLVLSSFVFHSFFIRLSSFFCLFQYRENLSSVKKDNVILLGIN